MQRRPLYVVAKVILVLCFAVRGGIVTNSILCAAISLFSAEGNSGCFK